MIVRTVVKVDSKNTLRRLKRTEVRLGKVGIKSTKDVGLWTRDNLIRYTPKDTSNTAKSIGIIKEVHSKGSDEVVVGLRYIPFGRSEESWRRAPISRNLFDYMMRSPRAFGRFRTGNIPALRNVPLMAIDRFRKRVIIETREVLK